MATLHGHYERMLRLDGADVTDEKGAAASAEGLDRSRPARRSTRLRRLGHNGVARAVQLLAEADLDLRGQQAWPRRAGDGGAGGPPVAPRRTYSAA